MADERYTTRTLAQILNELFPDDAPLQGGATMRKLRDLAGSAIGNGSASLRFATPGTPVATTIVTPNTAVKLAGSTTEDFAGANFTYEGDNRIVYTGAEKSFFRLSAIISASRADTEPFVLTFAINGVDVPASQQIGASAVAAGVDNVTTEWVVALSQNDFVEVFLNCGAAGAINVSTFFLSAQGVPGVSAA